MMAVFLFIAHEKGFKFHAPPQTGTYSCSILKAWPSFKIHRNPFINFESQES